MIKKNSLLTLLIFFALVCGVNAQNQQRIDSLLNKKFGELFNLTANAQDSAEVDFYARLLIKKGELIKETRGLQISNYAKCVGYHFLVNNIGHQDPKSLIYADSIISTMGSTSDGLFPSIAYQIKGDYHFFAKSYQKALENYLSVLVYARKEKKTNMIFRFNLDIGDLKRLIGDRDGAIVNYKENFRYIQKSPDSVTNFQYLYTIAGLSNIYNDKKMIDSAAFFNQYGMQKSIKVSNKVFQTNFALSQGITSFHEGKFQVAIDSFEKHLPYLKSIKDISTQLTDILPFSLYYNGESHLKLNQQEKAITYFKSVDSIFTEEKTLFPTLRPTYKHLIKYYKDKNDLKNELVYVTKLIKMDSALHENKLYLNREIIKEYDLPKLKEDLKESIKQRTYFKSAVIILSIVVVLLIIALIFQYRKRQRYKRRFQEIINSKPEQIKKENSIKKDDSKAINIQEDVIKDILDGLESFEKNREYLSKKINLSTLSKKLGTNPNYLSKVINHYKKCSFTKYLNNLRVEHSIEELKTNNTFRKYTIKAIAEEVGFNNVQAFAKAFYHNKGINPSYFLKELNKSLQPSDK